MHGHLCVVWWLSSSPVSFFLSFLLLFFQTFQTPFSVVHKKFMSKDLRDFRLGTVASNDHETPLTTSVAPRRAVNAPLGCSRPPRRRAVLATAPRRRRWVLPSRGLCGLRAPCSVVLLLGLSCAVCVFPFQQRGSLAPCWKAESRTSPLVSPLAQFPSVPWCCSQQCGSLIPFVASQLLHVSNAGTRVKDRLGVGSVGAASHVFLLCCGLVRSCCSLAGLLDHQLCCRSSVPTVCDRPLNVRWQRPPTAAPRPCCVAEAGLRSQVRSHFDRGDRSHQRMRPLGRQPFPSFVGVPFFGVAVSVAVSVQQLELPLLC